MKCEALRLGLEGVEVFRKLTDEQKSEEWNGIGPDRFPEWVRDMLSRIYHCILPAACIHDFDFAIGGTIEQYHEANRRLKRNMMICLKDSRSDFTLFGYLLSKLKIIIGCKLVDRYGLPGWKFT